MQPGGQRWLWKSYSAASARRWAEDKAGWVAERAWEAEHRAAVSLTFTLLETEAEVARFEEYAAEAVELALEAGDLQAGFVDQPPGVRGGAPDRASPNFMGLASLGLEISIFCDFRYIVFSY